MSVERCKNLQLNFLKTAKFKTSWLVRPVEKFLSERNEIDPGGSASISRLEALNVAKPLVQLACLRQDVQSLIISQKVRDVLIKAVTSVQMVSEGSSPGVLIDLFHVIIK